MKLKKVIITILGILLLIVALGVIFLPQILKGLGYHPDYEKVPYHFKDKKALIITTSHDVLGETGKATGVYPSEMTIPYYEFLDAGLDVDIASIKGGEIPLDPIGLNYYMKSHADKRYLKDEVALDKTKNSLSVADVDFLDYDIIFMAGGWGASYDLGSSEILGQKITDANTEGILLGSVCHGSLGFLMAKDTTGLPLVQGKKMTGVTDKQVKELNISITPMHPETELKKHGAIFQANTGIRDFLQTLTVVDGNIVTGQNQNSSGEAAQTLLARLNERSRE
ncbi:MAG TPA: type 1 glutamine amidotransferase domain-containing protein [Saprospiraceae bacterium]|nr:type 1 glutamine amidotransferase domain-containing protein [Saprospiraceae bacterium]HMQ84629.1 type 1 glutamine amidotransferase domain-containing protein [Saprospiraceae bacterium]